ncbi:MAG: peptide chain release factor N(5)-glutamine methyltransferase [Gammaproteobacteria bacterium]|nr:MAG: peptide chain release factor N(5)-glutamine methyltransferase [Gammaproteobacteria bacterium]
MKIEAALADAVERLTPVSESPRLDAELLLARALDVPRSYLFAHPEDELDSAAVKRFSTTIERRTKGAPLAYITGEKEFWSMTLMVTRDTLVPRPETETLVDQVLVRIPKREAMKVLDLGTGSGAIALAIAKERPICDVTATDFSAAALAVAQENARQHDLANIEFLLGDWLEPVAGQMFDVIATNPPYVPSEDPDLERLQHEPLTALASGADGLDAIRRIAVDAISVIKPGGSLLIEHGDEQHEAVAEILAQAGWTQIGVTNDLAGIPRVTTAVR